ncbi:PepSY-like domain-containing protein [Flavihumibacter stibioxidans]|uniref:Beta-lactamase-inhibitor-like PepSY-like domain-containing protein n=1 Tax=Flavihumibacter stibioxidans TaxID=1834163 RepID=A0ABR7M3W0_9BACT|nr:PepSY-like domain-containing protein [Flavihumibacter stibioxidans]MBC6489662.1 hypothetical protein [Flavihumibacter stibioxidans]
MKLNKMFLPALVVTFALFVTSCDNEKNEKDEKDEATETMQQEKTETDKKDTALATTTVLPAGEMPLQNLPVGIKKFIEINYNGYAMTKAVSDPLCQGGDAIDVAVTKSGAPNLSLIFKPDGSFVQQEEDVPMKTAPDKVRDAITAKYADYKAGEQIEKLQLADKTVQYLVDLTKGTTTKEVIFSKEGAIVCDH